MVQGGRDARGLTILGKRQKALIRAHTLEKANWQSNTGQEEFQEQSPQLKSNSPPPKMNFFVYNMLVIITQYLL